MAADDDAAADAGAENHSKDDLGIGARAPSLASESAKQLASLASRSSRRRSVSKVAAQRLADQAGRVGVLDPPVGQRLRPGNADADRPAPAELILERGRPARRPPAGLRNSLPAASRHGGAAPRPRRLPRAMASIFVPPRSTPMRSRLMREPPGPPRRRGRRSSRAAQRPGSVPADRSGAGHSLPPGDWRYSCVVMSGCSPPPILNEARAV
jgi:hypothetical protein